MPRPQRGAKAQARPQRGRDEAADLLTRIHHAIGWEHEDADPGASADRAAALAREVFASPDDRTRLWAWLREGGLTPPNDAALREWLERAAAGAGGRVCPQDVWPDLLTSLVARLADHGVWSETLEAWLERGSCAWHAEEVTELRRAGSEANALAQMDPAQLATQMLVLLHLPRTEWQRRQWTAQLVRMLPPAVLGLDTDWPNWAAWLHAATHEARAELEGWRQTIAEAGCDRAPDGPREPVARLRDTIASQAAVPDGPRRIERSLRRRTDWTPEAAQTLMRMPGDGVQRLWSLAGVTAPPVEALTEALARLNGELRLPDAAVVLRLGQTPGGGLVPVAAQAIAQWLVAQASTEPALPARSQDLVVGAALRHREVVALLERPHLVTLLQHLSADHRRRLVGTLAELRSSDAGDTPLPPPVGATDPAPGTRPPGITR